MSDESDAPKLPPAHEQHDADVTWGDFLAALPATLAMQPEGERSNSEARASSSFVPRRVVHGSGALPRAYLVARASARRERSTPRPEACARPEYVDDELVASDSAPPAPASGSDELSAPRDRVDARSRWLVSGLVLTGSVIVAVLTSVITVRAMNPAAPHSLASARQPDVAVTTPVVASRDTSGAVQPLRNVDTSRVLVATQSAAAPTSRESGDTVIAPAPAVRSAPSPMRVARASGRSAQRGERHSLSIAEHARTAPQPSSVIPSARISTSMTGASSEGAGSASVPAATTAQQSAAPAATVPASNNSAVLDELRAIHAEIDARKKHMDSLTAALDSLKRIPKPD